MAKYVFKFPRRHFEQLLRDTFDDPDVLIQSMEDNTDIHISIVTYDDGNLVFDIDQKTGKIVADFTDAGNIVGLGAARLEDDLADYVHKVGSPAVNTANASACKCISCAIQARTAEKAANAKKGGKRTVRRNVHRNVHRTALSKRNSRKNNRK